MIPKCLQKISTKWANFETSKSKTPIDPDTYQATCISQPSLFNLFMVPAIQITSSSGCGEKHKAFFLNLADSVNEI